MQTQQRAKQLDHSPCQYLANPQNRDSDNHFKYHTYISARNS